MQLAVVETVEVDHTVKCIEVMKKSRYQSAKATQWLQVTPFHTIRPVITNTNWLMYVNELNGIY